VIINGFRWGTTCFKCQITFNIVLLLSVIFSKSELSSLKVRLSGGFGTGSSLLCGTCLIAESKSGYLTVCVWIWRRSLLCMLNKSSNQMSGPLVPSKLWEQWMAFGVNHLPMLKKPHTCYATDMKGSTFYVGHPPFTQNKSHNILSLRYEGHFTTQVTTGVRMI
jgi:hypothetical protein